MNSYNDRLPYDFTAHLTHFCRALRSHGLLIGPTETADVMRAMNAVDMMDRGRVYWSLRSLLLSRRDDIPIYDSLFERFWNFEAMPVRPRIDSDDDLVGGAKEFRRAPSVAVMPEEDASAENTLVQMLRTGASSRAAARQPDLSVLRAGELSELSRIAARMIRAMASRPGRRRKRHPRKGSPDLRAAFRVNMSRGGDMLLLPRKRRVPRTPRLLVMLDVSGSMERHCTAAVAAHLRGVAAHEAGGDLRVQHIGNAGDAGAERAVVQRGAGAHRARGGALVGRHAHRGGAGACEQAARAYPEPLYDGVPAQRRLGYGEPERLAAEVRRMRRRVHRVVWLNPLLGSADYEPLTRSLQAALPHIDHHASARDIDSLKRLPGLLR